MFALKHEFNGCISFNVDVLVIRSMHGHDEAMSSQTAELLLDLRGLPSEIISNDTSSLYLNLSNERIKRKKKKTLKISNYRSYEYCSGLIPVMVIL